jgi:hypothetical protein
MNTNDNREFLYRRGELMAELFLQDLKPFYVARNTSADFGIDFFIGFSNSRGGVNLIGVEVKATEHLQSMRYQISSRTYDLLAKSNIPGILLVVDVKNNRYFYHLPSQSSSDAKRKTVTVELVEVNEETREFLRTKLTKESHMKS